MSAPMVKSGEWVEGLDEGGVVVVERATGRIVARLGDCSPATIAHAKLMGRAPDLADALLAIADYEPRSNDQCHVGICPMEECGNCKRILAARAALRAAGRIP